MIGQKLLGDQVPVPEAYGWRIDDGQLFIYMELVQGQPLIDQWNSMSISDKVAFL